MTSHCPPAGEAGLSSCLSQLVLTGLENYLFLLFLSLFSSPFTSLPPLPSPFFPLLSSTPENCSSLKVYHIPMATYPMAAITQTALLKDSGQPAGCSLDEASVPGLQLG